MPSLLGSRLKIERAKEHLDDLEPEIRAYVDRDPYRTSDKPDVDGVWMIIRITEVREYPDPRWGVRIGEFLHDLRSALDNLVWQLLLMNREEPGNHNQFPIYTDPPGKPRLKALNGVPGATRIDDMLLGVDREHSEAIKELQPYLGHHMHREHRLALRGVANLNNVDKHRFVHPAAGIRERAEAGLITHVGGPAPDNVEVTYTSGLIYPGAELFRWRVVGGSSETVVTMEGQVPVDIAFSYGDVTLSRLDWLWERIAQIIERFASAFPGDSVGAKPAHDKAP